MKDYLFVYGTLAEENASQEIAGTIKKLKCVGEGFIFGRLYDLGEYPGAVLDTSPSNKIFGKIYELPGDPELLDRLDAYEEFDPEHPAKSLFVRRQASITRPNKKKVKGWVYEYNGDVRSLPLILFPNSRLYPIIHRRKETIIRPTPAMHKCNLPKKSCS